MAALLVCRPLNLHALQVGIRRDGAYGEFPLDAPARVMGVPGVEAAHVVRAWLNIQVAFALEQSAATRAHELVNAVANLLGLDGVLLQRPVEHRDRARVSSLEEWLVFPSRS